MDLSLTEENYLKAIFKLSSKKAVNTNSIAEEVQTAPASVSDMIKKLAAKKLVDYRKYQGVKLTELGEKKALRIIRKHRLWEVFLVDKLQFNWDEVHDIAEQLEHIKSPLLIKKLDEHLGFPRFDPHGDPIPDEDGNMNAKQKILLSIKEINSEGTVIGLNDSSDSFLQYLNKLGIYIGAKIKLVDKIPFDNSVEVIIDAKLKTNLSHQIAENIYIAE